MILAWMTILSIMFLLDPEEHVDVARLRAISSDADRGGTQGGRAGGEKSKSARITSRTSDFDRKEGVSLFEGNVTLHYSDDCVLCADRLWAFAIGSNQLDRVVVIGNVSVTNEMRVGTCALAVFRRRQGEVEMFGDDKGTVARLVEHGESTSALEGRRIKFWIDTEQVEVDSSRITTQTERDRKKLQ